jgi:hypothetical protein
MRIVIAGLEKMGKTTLTSLMPTPLLVPLEVGYGGVNVAKTPMLQSLAQLMQLMGEIMQLAQQGQFPYRTIIFDSATALERQIHDAVIRRDPAFREGSKKTITMESAHGGYGKAYTLANEEFESFLKLCDQLAVYAGINIVLTCHVFASKMMDPTSGEYDSWDLLMHSPKNMKTYGKREMITQWADLIGFLYEPVFVSKADNMTRAVSQNKGRVIGLSRTPGYVAGNRYGVVGELSIPPIPANGWNIVAHAIYQASGADVFTR